MDPSVSPYDLDLDRTPANHAPLTPLSFLTRAARVFPHRTAVIHDDGRWTWREFEDRCQRLAWALLASGVGPGDTVAVLAPNIPAALEAHFGVPAAGAVLNMLNIRLDPDAIAFQLAHGGAKAILVDSEFREVADAALARLSTRPLVVHIEDPAFAATPPSALTYEAFLASAEPQPLPALKDEWAAIALNYTSGTTGNPKGVVYHHRGAFLNAISNALAWQMRPHPVYLWTLPMFHCNGWCFPWTLALQAGVSVCLRKVEPAKVFELLKAHGVEYLCGAPVVMSMLANAPAEAKRLPPHRVQIMTAGSAPPASVIGALQNDGFEVCHVYGLTEVYGPSTVCAWQEEWNALPEDEQLRRKARQGVAYPLQEEVMVAHPASLEPVPRDGEEMGEVFIRGNSVMKGYLKNPAATAEAFAGGWFHTGDLAVWRADGYIEIKDRSKDIIISGGENISTIEIEEVLYQHAAVLEAAVVQRPDSQWGERPCAFVTLKSGSNATEAELIGHCAARLARFKLPKSVVFGSLPKTSTGKIQKYVLRAQAEALGPT